MLVCTRRTVLSIEPRRCNEVQYNNADEGYRISPIPLPMNCLYLSQIEGFIEKLGKGLSWLFEVRAEASFVVTCLESRRPTVRGISRFYDESMCARISWKLGRPAKNFMMSAFSLLRYWSEPGMESYCQVAALESPRAATLLRRKGRQRHEALAIPINIRHRQFARESRSNFFVITYQY